MPDEDCVFCRIIRREAEAGIAYEDDDTLAFIDQLRQPREGHTLVVPKTHIRDIFELDDATGAALMRTVARVSSAARTAFSADGISNWISNGEGANQEVPHLHVHVMPRHKGDSLFFRVYSEPPHKPTQAEADEQAARLNEALLDASGVPDRKEST